MELRELYIRNFGKLHEVRFLFGKGIHLIEGPNESGKSTLYECIKAMLFGIQKQRGRAAARDRFHRFAPSDPMAEYGASLRFVIEGKEFLLTRSFAGEGKGILVCPAEREELSLEKGDLSMLLGEISETVFENTISVGQCQTATDEAFLQEVRNRFAALEQSGEAGLDVQKALSKLRKKQKELEGEQQEQRAWKEQERRMLEKRVEYLEEDLILLRQNLQEVKRQILEEKRKQQERREAYEDSRYREGREAYDDSGYRESRKAYDDSRYDGRRGYPGEQETASQRALQDQRREVYEGPRYSEGRAAYEDSRYEEERPERRKKKKGLLARIFEAIAAFFRFLFGLDREETEQADDPDRTGILNQTAASARESIRDSKRETVRGGSLDDPVAVSWRDSERETVRESIRELESRVFVYSKQIREKQQQLENAKTDLAEFSDRIPAWLEEQRQACIIAEKTIRMLAEKRQAKVGGALERRVSELLCEFTDGRYDRLTLDGGLQMQFHHGTVRYGDHQVSRGTLELAYLALRIAAGELFCREEILPLFLDEIFALYDDHRLANVLRWMGRQDRQILLFTCQNREKTLLTRLGIPFREILL